VLTYYSIQSNNHLLLNKDSIYHDYGLIKFEIDFAYNFNLICGEHTQSCQISVTTSLGRVIEQEDG